MTHGNGRIQAAGKPKLTAIFWMGYYMSGKSTLTERLEELGELVFQGGRDLRKYAERKGDAAALQAIAQGRQVDDEFTLRAVKMWVVGHIMTATDGGRKRQRLHFDGMPRNTDQLRIACEFLREHGYEIRVVRFITPQAECRKREARKGRPEDINPALIEQRDNEYRTKTIPMFHALDTYGICVQNENILLIDNTNLMPHDSAKLIVPFLGLPHRPEQMFPKEEHRPRPAHSALADESPRIALPVVEGTLAVAACGEGVNGEQPRPTA